MAQRRTRRNPNTQSNPTTPNLPPDHIGLLFGSVVMIILGWGGLYWLISTQLPRLGGEIWLFFVLLFIALSGTALPIVRYLNVRFTALDTEVPPTGVIVRQSVWVGLTVVTCAWLQMLRSLSLPMIILMVAVFVVLETFLRSREIANEKESL
jgi:hypothetical protein